MGSCPCPCFGKQNVYLVVNPGPPAPALRSTPLFVFLPPPQAPLRVVEQKKPVISPSPIENQKPEKDQLSAELK